MIAYGITLTGDIGMPRRVSNAMQPKRIAPVMGRAVTNVVRVHLFEKNRTGANALGGKRTNFYSQAARATSFQFDGNDTVIVSISHIGIRQRYYGGVIRAKKAKFLTIPVAPQAHGKRAREFADLEMLFGPDGQPWALATKGDRRVQITQNAKGQTVKKMVGRRGIVLFRLVKSVTQKPDPSVLPLPDRIMGAAISAANEYIALVAKPPSNPSAN